MAARHVARLAGWTAAAIAVPVVLSAAGRPWGLVGIGLVVAISLWLVLWLPRAAHAAFEAGRFAEATRRYRLLVATAFTSGRERAAQLSRAGCDIAAGRLGRAERILAGFDGPSLPSAERVTWLNNRACLALEASVDPIAALALAEQAIALRPDIPAVHHTRAAALIALGRCDEAIGILEQMRQAAELAPALEAVRCRELAKAWDAKGQHDYAADYRDRARLIAS